MSVLLAIDPSINSCGVAVFDNGALIHSECVKIKPNTSLDIAQRCRLIAIEVGLGQICVPQAIAHEWPQIYERDSPAIANAIITMAAVNLAIDLFFWSASVHSYRPVEIWGQLPKFKHGNVLESPRAKRIVSRLTPAELAWMPAQHDAIDAVGIGLHHLGRLGIRRAPFSNGRDRIGP